MNEQEYIYEKVAEAHAFLASHEIDPVEGMMFAENFRAAADEEEEDKVAAEYDDLDGRTIEKIAEAVDYLSDIEGVPLSALMEEFEEEQDKVAASKTMKSVKKGLSKAKEILKGDNIHPNGKSFKFYKNKKAIKREANIERAKTYGARAGVAGAGGGAVYGGYQAFR